MTPLLHPQNHIPVTTLLIVILTTSILAIVTIIIIIITVTITITITTRYNGVDNKFGYEYIRITGPTTVPIIMVLPLSQWYYSGGAVVLQWCRSGVTVVSQWCLSGVVESSLFVIEVLQWGNRGIIVVLK
jgi:hypothetical protein